MLRPLPPRPARGAAASRAVALFALAVMIEAVLARRFDLIDTPTLLAALFAVALAGVLALAIAGVAIGDVWRDGAPGAPGAIFAGILVVLVLAPFVGAGIAVIVYPPLYDISTDTGDPPRFMVPRDVPEPLLATAVPGSVAPRLQAEAYADVAPRRLPLSTVEAHAASHLAAVELGWTIVAESEPAGESDAGVFQATTRDPFLATPADVVVRILPSATGSRVDVRSASRYPVHDIGENARRIRSFFARLDEITTRPAAG